MSELEVAAAPRALQRVVDAPAEPGLPPARIARARELALDREAACEACAVADGALARKLDGVASGVEPALSAEPNGPLPAAPVAGPAGAQPSVRRRQLEPRPRRGGVDDLLPVELAADESAGGARRAGRQAEARGR